MLLAANQLVSLFSQTLSSYKYGRIHAVQSVLYTHFLHSCFNIWSTCNLCFCIPRLQSPVSRIKSRQNLHLNNYCLNLIMILLYNVVACIISNMYSCPSSFSESYLVLCSPSVLFIWTFLHWVHTAITLGMTCILQYDPDFFYYFCCCWFFFFHLPWIKDTKKLQLLGCKTIKKK